MARGMPILCVGRSMEGVSSWSFDFEKDNCNVARLMLQEGRRKIMLVEPPAAYSLSQGGAAGVDRAFSEFGLAFDKAWVVADSEEERKAFGRTLDLLRPDAIIFNVDILPDLSEIKSRLDIVEGCRLYSGEWSVGKDMGYSGYLGVADLHDSADLAAENLLSQLESPQTGRTLDCVMDMKMILHNAKGVVDETAKISQ